MLHLGNLSGGTATLGEGATCLVDYERRALVVPNHTMTHVLNYALRQVLMVRVMSYSSKRKKKKKSRLRM